MSAGLALAQREIVRFLRQKSRVVGAVAPPLVMWLLVGSGFGARSAGTRFGYFFPGTVVLVVLFAAIFATISVIEDRREGFLQGVLVSPVAPASIAFGKILGGTRPRPPAGPAAPRPRPRRRPLGRRRAASSAPPRVLVLLAFALTSLGFAIAWSLESTQGFHAIMNLFLIPMWLLSGCVLPRRGRARAGSARRWPSTRSRTASRPSAARSAAPRRRGRPRRPLLRRDGRVRGPSCSPPRRPSSRSLPAGPAARRAARKAGPR